MKAVLVAMDTVTLLVGAVHWTQVDGQQAACMDTVHSLTLPSIEKRLLIRLR